MSDHKPMRQTPEKLENGVRERLPRRLAPWPARWWQTIPGMLTAAGGAITAVAGLVAALHQIGLFGGIDNSGPAQVAATPSQPIRPVSKAAAAKDSQSTLKPSSTPPQATTNEYALSFPSGTEVKFRNHRSEGTYKVIAAVAERRTSGKLTIRFTIRLTNAGPSDVSFGNDSFRLLQDGVPVSWLNEAVDARSAKDGNVEFETTDTVNDLRLQVLVGDRNETADVPLTLRAGSHSPATPMAH
jgi:hypothetical protein